MSAIRKLFGTNYIDSYYTKLYQVGFVESLSFLNACYLNFKLRVTWPGLPAALIHSVLISGRTHSQVIFVGSQVSYQLQHQIYHKGESGWWAGPPSFCADQKALPGSGGVPHYRLPTQHQVAIYAPTTKLRPLWKRLGPSIV